MPPDSCPPNPESAAEEYALGRLPHADASAFEDHCTRCPKCRALLEREGFIVGMMRAAARAKGEPSTTKSK